MSMYTGGMSDREAVHNHPGIYERNGSYCFRVTTAAGRRWVTVPKKLGIQEAERQRNKHRLTPTLQAGTTTLFLEYALEWVKTRSLKPRVREEYERNIRTHLSPLHRMKLSQIRPPVVRRLSHDLLEAGLSPGTVRNVLATLSSLMSTAVEDGLVDQHPVKSLARGSRPSVKRGEKIILTESQLRALVVLEGQWGVYTSLGLLAGLRQSEALGLQWEDVKDDHILIRRQLGRDGTLTSLKGDGQDDKTRRVELSNALRQKLIEHKFVTGRRAGFVLTTRTGRPQNHRNARRSWDKIKADLGLPAGLTYHQLRHNYASILIASGEDVVKVSHQMGHSDPSITMRTYSHLFQMAKRAGSSAAAIDEAVGA